MRNQIRATMVASAFAIVLGSLGLGCPSNPPDPATGGAGGEAGQGGGSGTCADGETKTCYSGSAGTEGTGQCKGGTATCSGGTWSACMGEVPPADETCNGVDDDCNGQVDDGFAPITCGVGACQVMVDGCVNGMVPSCQPTDPQTETCDGTDEDCDGQIDNGDVCPCTDGTTQPCYSGNPAMQGVGECAPGTQTCVNGSWGACENEVLPAMETCDGLDNDCDGQADDNLGQKTCGAGACLKSVEACVNGMPQTCTPGQPKPEICNNLDDDCNLFIDDGLGSFTCGTGACLVTVPACAGGMPQTCTPGMPMTEICDGIDNNCNGITDEGNPGGGIICNTGLSGTCATGTLNCSGGALQCVPNSMPLPEMCDGIDNNCNGMIDDGNPGGGQGCNTGLFGLCALGSTKCMNGSVQCTATTMPSAEMCDGVDNDCDGATDEGTSGLMCTVAGKLGACAISASQCSNGSLLCQQTVFPAAVETCNGVDDTCNGQVDEGNPGGGAACNVPNKLGECAKGTLTCAMGALDCPQSIFPVSEACGDGKDNDCDGAVDNGCCPHSVCTAGVAMPQGCGGNTCVTDICNYGGGGFASCCTGTWNNGCTVVADFACGAGTCCAHNVCTLGTPLSANCSSCVAAVCNAIPSCCTTGWTQACVDALPTYCNGIMCVQNP